MHLNKLGKKFGVLLLIPFFLFQSSLLYAYSPQDPVLARFGGGEDYGDGGYDSNDSSGSGNDTIDFGSSTNLGNSGSSGIDVNPGKTSGSIGCCGIFIIVVIVIIFVIIKSKSEGSSKKQTTKKNSSTNSRKNSSQDDKLKDLEKQLKELKERDSDFDKQKFKDYARKVFMACQQAWTERDLNLCRPFLSEDIFQMYKTQVDNMKKNKVINVLENIVIGSSEIVRIELSKNFDRITVKFRASMKDYKVKEGAKDKIISGSKDQTPPFTEYWVFIRKSGVKTKVKEGIFDRKCPNCGAPIEVDIAGTCKYCDANVVNGDYDWVLSEIIQNSEWQN